MENSDESEQEASLQLYKSQLSQVDLAIEAAGDSEDLTKLKSDLGELIKLTEDNLLEIKRAKLLQMLGTEEDEEEEETAMGTSTTKETEDIDDEYAAFQAAIAGNSNLSQGGDSENSGSKTHGGNEASVTEKHSTQDDIHIDDFNDDGDDSYASAANESLLELVGTKCRAPFSQEWGDLHYGNALILSIDPPEHAGHLEECKVHVIFINPTHQSMVPCKYFMEEKCRFSPQDCRKLKEGCRCLAKPGDEDVWYQCVVVEVCNDHELRVRYDSTKEEDIVLVEHAIPLDYDDSDDDTDSDADSSDSDSIDHQKVNHHPISDSEEENAVPVYLWKPLQTTEKLGAWETHTKGIGSKLMAKMGYITGQGLGRYGDGRAEPVPILVLPQGKSLDKIMQLKEMAGDHDLFNANKRLEKRQRMLEKKEAEKGKRKKDQQKFDVFGFLNVQLGKNRGEHRPHSQTASTSSAHPPSSSSSPVVHAKQSSEKELSTRSDKEVNLQIFKTAEAIRGVERTLNHLRRQLARNESKDRKMAEKVRQKITEEENNLRKLKNSSQTLETHKDRRKAHKKLTIF